jgi:hypothetical protein
MPAAPGVANPPDANPAVLPPALNAPVVPDVEPAPSVSRVLVQRGWEAARNGVFFYPSSEFPRIHIVLAPDAAPYDAQNSLYRDVKTVEVQSTHVGGGGMMRTVFWLDGIQQRLDQIQIRSAYAQLTAQGKVILNDLLAA